MKMGNAHETMFGDNKDMKLLMLSNFINYVYI